MIKPPRETLFLERSSYRQRRLRDMARVLPVVGIILWSVPLLWRSDETVARGTATAVVYVFAVWCILIIAAAIISLRIKAERETDGTEDEG